MIVTLGLSEIKRNSYISSSFTPPTYPHSHEFYEISFCVQSKCLNVINNQKIPFYRGICVLMRPKDFHYYEGIIPQSHYEHIDLYAPIERFIKLCDSCDDDLFNRIEDAPSPIVIELSGDIYEYLFKQSLALKELIQNKNENFTIVYNAMICTILGEWAKNKNHSNNQLPNWLVNLLPQFNNVSFLRNSITNIAKITNFSLPYFSKQFKTYMGVSAINYLNKKKVYISKELLADNKDLKIIDISNMLGYENPSTFCKHFLNEYHITPTEYRKSILSSTEK